jgi:beta-lactamase class A
MRGISLSPHATWSVAVTDSVRTLFEHDPGTVLPIADIGRLLILSAVAEDFDAGVLDPAESLPRAGAAPAHGGGLWQHLREEELRADTVAALVGAVGDDLGTNVLLQRVGLERVAAAATKLRLWHTAVHDIIRDDRDPDLHEPTFATSCAADLVALMNMLRSGHLLGPRASGQVLRWMAYGVNPSLVLAPLGMDPSRPVRPGSPRVWHETGSDVGVLADCGVVEHEGHWMTYAAIAHWDPEVVDDEPIRDSMASIGQAIAGHLGAATTTGRGQPTSPRIYHIAFHSEWAAAQGVGEYTVSTRDRGLADVGFIHCSTATQWPVVLDGVYADVGEGLLLLEIDPAQVHSPVRFEEGDPATGEEFPHIYGPLPISAVVAASAVKVRSAD